MATPRTPRPSQPTGLHALRAAGEAAGVAVDWSVAAPVVTSARRSERTPTGFSAYLTRLEARLGSEWPA